MEMDFNGCLWTAVMLCEFEFWFGVTVSGCGSDTKLAPAVLSFVFL